MYKVLLVDDERIILEGISKVVNWSSVGTELAGTCRNGIEAYEHIVQAQPDIIISDIKMPGMDGLQLAAKVAATYPRIKFIMLSGFGEFDYAQTAMQYGVKHYLLKPCNETKIMEALTELVTEIKQTESAEYFIKNIKDGLVKVLPHVKEQFLKEFVTNKTYGAHDWEYYRKLFELDLEERNIRLILFKLEGSFEFEHLFAVKNIAGEILQNSILSTTVGDHVLMVVEDTETTEELYELIDRVQLTFLQYYKIDLTIALSEADAITQARKLYKETLECLNHRFYLGEGSLITRSDIGDDSLGETHDFIYDEENLLLQIKTGRSEDVCHEMDAFFESLSSTRSDIPLAKSYVIQLYMAIIRLSDADTFNAYLEKLVTLMEMTTLKTIQVFIKNVASEIAQQHYNHKVHQHSSIIQKVIAIIEEQVSHQELSLNRVAHEMLYMNADYLGKLFKKETGEKFSNYVMKFRINKAMALLEHKEDVKIFELAEQLGFGDNPQYFSQVFKKYTGLTPSEYIKKI
ncbi:DNA-binding response regulator [Paenibacillus psychroresistens]|uniref:DNA-binding response regulator n=1 Tax=Paenibacillus psychroresistens TaxID=1778678 RepID=A0A6B8RCB6_9BACL|nr:response regulator [Paenibacillus psychroresistens]QGQ93840.1 DNA-binding response regulator [Paenibacillus psychroresistens]